MEPFGPDPLELPRLLFENNIKVALIYGTAFVAGCFVFGRAVRNGLVILGECLLGDEDEEE
jgi:hypothetical protein